ncbi:carboxypeptidase-like regulatory domain-containing protein [Flavobacteriaceae bacterium XHP0103]|uniref:carboxypeptidase-like regulatory domain-containing protein n=1 Tax=Marixanthotalea marina TaxID=2844359 RepID=UPI002989DEF7|nr:carboxypeptidase-like regulatory domain-containing protein [Marixanthotalea marina]MBU3821912.1 carboxypeptidase-like regulatory domain-containing protein [Marixanthotalea marina]
MTKTNCLVLLFCMGAIMQGASQTIEISGWVKSSADVENVNVVNVTSHMYAITDVNGKFYIEVKLNDSLRFSSLLHKTKTVVIDQNAIATKNLTIYLEEQINELEEVVVGGTLTGDLLYDVKNIDAKPPINFYDVGIPGYTGRRLTQSERRLRQAGEFKPIMLVGLLAGSMPLDPIINGISGRTKMLKERVAVEGRELLMQSIKDRLGKDFFASNPLDEELRMDFFYFCADDEHFVEKCKSKTDFEVFEFLEAKYKQYMQNRNDTKD